MIRRFLAAAVIIAAVLGSSGAAAQQWTVEPSVSAQVTVTSNARYGGGVAAASDTIFDVSPAIDVSRRGSKLNIEGRLGVDAIHYLRGAQPNQYIPRGEIRAMTTLVDEVAGLDASLSFAQPRVNTLGAPADSPTVPAVTATRRYLSPYIDYHASTDISLYARSDNTWTRTSGSGAETLPFDGSYVQEDVLRFDVRPRPLGLTVEGSRSDTKFSGDSESALTLDAVRVVGWMGFAPTKSVGLIAGTERSRFLLTNATDPIYGVRLDWASDSGALVRGSLERRFFGSGWNLNVAQRMNTLALNLNLRREPTTFPASLGRIPAGGNVADMLDAALMSRYADPAARSQVVRQLMDSRGLPTTLASAFTLYTANPQLNQVVDASLVLLGQRTTVTLFALHNRIEGLVRRDSGQIYTPAFGTDNAQDSLGLDVNYRLTRLTALDVTTSVWRIVGLGALQDQRSYSGLLRGTLLTTLSPSTTALVGARYQRLESNFAQDESEAAVFVGLVHRFR